ncbi:MAG: hypothetical protein LUG26_04440 [Ruminococcus sp.]|nr:hypothetical protein [Ruminococcus sp.]
MIKKFLSGICAASLMTAGIIMSGLASNAATIDEVAETARKLGFPENAIQQGLNQYYEDPDLYTDDVLDDAIAYLYEYESDLKAQLGITDTTSDGTSSSDTTEQHTDSTSDSTESQTTNTFSEDSTTSGSTTDSEFIDESDFNEMTLEEKREYISTLSTEDQQTFFNSLSADTLKNIVKQLPTDDKAEVLDTFVKAGEAMGIYVTVDEMNDESISMSMKNSSGELIDVASVGVIIEDTGYDYRGIFLVSGTLIITAIGILGLLLRKCFKKEAEDRK